MSSETGDRRPTRLQHTGPRPQEPENLPCPRCDSTNTKFCYYNNYNLSQPRHFCKSCRRYWTRGGTLRNVPVGGGTRKVSSKRSRTTPSPTAITTATESFSSSTVTPELVVANSVSIIPGIKPEMGSGALLFGHADLNQTVVPRAAGPFTSLLNTQGAGVVLPNLRGYGVGSGFRTMGFEISMLDWPMEQVGEVDDGGVGVGAAAGDARGTVHGGTSGCNTWHIGGNEGGLADGDYFVWPNLAISSPSKGLK